MEISVATKRVCAIFAATSVLALGAVTEANASPAPSVTISGKAYRFESIEQFTLVQRGGKWLASKAETTQQ